MHKTWMLHPPIVPLYQIHVSTMASMVFYHSIPTTSVKSYNSPQNFKQFKKWFYYKHPYNHFSSNILHHELQNPNAYDINSSLFDDLPTSPMSLSMLFSWGTTPKITIISLLLEWPFLHQTISSHFSSLLYNFQRICIVCCRISIQLCDAPAHLLI